MAAPTTLIYHRRNSGAMAKALASRIQQDPRGIKTLLCWGDKFRDERDIEPVPAVVIQRSLPNATFIATCYQSFVDECEIHYVDDDGNFEEEGAGDAPEPPPEPEPAPDASDPEPAEKPAAPDPAPQGGDAGGDGPEDPQAA